MKVRDRMLIMQEDDHGIFYISNMYHALCQFENTNPESSWKNIWNVTAPERVYG